MKRLQIQLTKVECISESFGEWGKDEMTLIGFGITKSGQRFYLQNRNLGSFATGDSVSGGEDYPKLLVDTEVPDGEDGLSICAWLIERDGGRLSLSTSRDQFLSVYETGYQNALAAAAVLDLPAEGRHLYAFAQAMMGMRVFMDARAEQGGDRDDDVYTHVFHNLGATSVPRLEMNPFTMEFLSELHYRLTFHYKMPRVLITA